MEGIQFEEDKYTSKGNQYGTSERGFVLNFLISNNIISDINKAKKIILISSVLFVLISFFLFIYSMGGDYDTVNVGDLDYVPAE